jgi:hypothetical protein
MMTDGDGKVTLLPQPLPPQRQRRSSLPSMELEGDYHYPNNPPPLQVSAANTIANDSKPMFIADLDLD